jgi:cardiolipin synthase (CMP-forming)
MPKEYSMAGLSKAIYRNLTLANKITILRLLLVPVLIYLLFSYAHSVIPDSHTTMLRYGAAALFVLIFLLDILDGLVARLGKQITTLGAILDPVADKALIISSLIALANMPDTAFEQHIPNWFVLITISRDVYLLIGSVIVYSLCNTLAIKPHITGKSATFFNVLVIVCVLLDLQAWIFFASFALAIALTAGSAVQYSFDGALQLRKKFTPGLQPASLQK